MLLFTWYYSSRFLIHKNDDALHSFNFREKSNVSSNTKIIRQNQLLLKHTVFQSIVCLFFSLFSSKSNANKNLSNPCYCSDFRKFTKTLANDVSTEKISQFRYETTPFPLLSFLRLYFPFLITLPLPTTSFRRSFLSSLSQSSIPLPFPSLVPPLVPSFLSFLVHLPTAFAYIFQTLRFEHMIYSDCTRYPNGKGTGNNDLSGQRGYRFGAKIFANVFFDRNSLSFFRIFEKYFQFFSFFVAFFFITIVFDSKILILSSISFRFFSRFIHTFYLG